MDQFLCAEALQLLSGTNPVSVPQIAMALRELSPQQETLRDDIASYVQQLKNIGLISDRNGLYKLNVSVNPNVSERHRYRMIAGGVRQGAGEAEPMTRRGSVNPTVMLPEVKKTRGRKRSASRSRGQKGMKRKRENSKEPKMVTKRARKASRSRRRRGKK